VTNKARKNTTSNTLFVGKKAQSKKRGTKKVSSLAHKKGTGMSKRLAANKKMDKKITKVQKRIAKGMGKAKK